MIHACTTLCQPSDDPFILRMQAEVIVLFATLLFGALQHVFRTNLSEYRPPVR
ncbi:hypothetical protein OBBRIDRAFT_791934 [Obba rivulosa]|uniref:Uncharacterized protein n=1 Tax=Obba rivulosa TaxID=1052685 RepID=A0A8E2B0Y7_9APHY|nr:hypothetical protein OBBRIDRAFT_791934 [Obba rivulosa]